MKLYDCTPAPSPRRTRILLAEKGIDVETVQIDLGAREQLGDDYRRINPRCTVPALVLDDGRTLTENVAIAHYLEEIHPQPPLFGKTAYERALVLEWNARIEQEGFLALAEAFRNSAKGFVDRALTGPVNYAQIPQLAERGLARAKVFKEILNARLAEQEFIAIQDFSLADITALVFADFAGWVKIPVSEEHPHLKRWYDVVSARPSAQA